MVTTTYAVDISTRVGSEVVLRSLERGDRASLLEIFAGLSPRSRQRRFLTPKTRLTDTELRYLTDVDHEDHVAVLAVCVATGRPVGVARFVRWADKPDSADVAVAVVDAWQSRGIGTLLSEALVRRALDVGVRRFTVLMQRDNAAALHLLRRNRTLVTRLGVDAETVELEVTLDVG